MFLSLDGTFWVQLVNFAIFFALLNVVFLRPVGAAIKQRREYIESIQTDYEKYAAQISSSQADADQKRSAARRVADETIAKARAAAEDEAGKILAEKGDDAAAMVDRARRTVAGEVETARARETELAQTLANSLLERVLGGTR
jgi:F0F1-type ATP synthase membrane subunit b/b'